MKSAFKITIFLMFISLMVLLNARLDKVGVYQVKSGVGFAKVSQDLQSKTLLILAYLTQATLKAGYYQIEPNMRVVSLLRDLHAGRVKTVQITLVEGKNLQNYWQQLKQNPALVQHKKLDHIMQALKISKPYEGWFFPETYQINYGQSIERVFQLAHQMMNNKLTKIWRERDTSLPLKTPYELLVLASLIEKESAYLTEKPLISSVFINRINQKMRLQTDPSVIYALGGRYRGYLRKQDLSIKSPMNTYKNKGLPPSAIASPSMSSLLAAAHPKSTSLLYFVAKKDKTHSFAKTYQAHRNNIQKHLKKTQKTLK
jgi:UPF0755 protein